MITAIGRVSFETTTLECTIVYIPGASGQALTVEYGGCGCLSGTGRYTGRSDGSSPPIFPAMKHKLLPALVVVLGVAALMWRQMQVEPLNVSGFIEADEIRVGSRVGGRVQEVLVEEGQSVKLNTL